MFTASNLVLISAMLFVLCLLDARYHLAIRVALSNRLKFDSSACHTPVEKKRLKKMEEIYTTKFKIAQLLISLSVLVFFLTHGIAPLQMLANSVANVLHVSPAAFTD